ncbi:glycosyltransferase family 2 protein [Chitinispirillales bacterium ANBcel5]|uniref:glycosyltransferase family 2 protein n=1 Tax=Cellulosispirillum alkaliphilum TaxID=3039283 RepID=UPI002A50A6F1|nr:glycosyltransferase family 2 protein [Chitinispirillales bacterium ANBcel5]
MKKRVSILLTCHNRKKNTLACLERVHTIETDQIVLKDVYLVDDGSTDGTAQAVSEQYPDVAIIKGNGSLFWNKGMHLAFKEAAKRDYDFYLWLNDDTLLYDNALDVLIEAWKKNQNEACIVSGTTCDPEEKNKTTYGGMRRKKGIHPFKFELVEPNETIQHVDTINGNIVLVPRSVYKKIGNLTKSFPHAFGDMDYAFRAKKAGCSVIIAQGYLGECSRNSSVGTWKDVTLPFKIRIKKMLSSKGLPFKDWMLFSFRHGGMLWPVWSFTPYLKVIYNSILYKKKI